MDNRDILSLFLFIQGSVFASLTVFIHWYLNIFVFVSNITGPVFTKLVMQHQTD